MSQHHPQTESQKAGRFVKREIDRVRRGEHGVRSPKQAIAIGLSEARRAGVKVPKKPGMKASSAGTAKRRKSSETSAKRSAATMKALKREPTSTVSHKAMSKQAKSAAAKRGAAARSRSARKAARTRKAS